MKWQTIAAAAAIISVPSVAFSADDTIEELKRKIQELDQKVRILERKRELDSEVLDVKFKDATSKQQSSIFKLPDWVTSVRLGNDLRMRYDQIYAPDSDFVTRWRIRPRLR